jgi:hypothetical protein
MISKTWLSLSNEDRNQRRGLLNFLLSGDGEFFSVFTHSSALYAYSIGELDAASAQKILRPASSTVELENLFQGNSWKESDLLADSAFLNVDQIEILLAVGNFRIDSTIARNLVTPANVLEKLSRHTDVNVRIGVAANPNLPEDILRNLLSGEDPAITGFALRNCSLSEDDFTRILDDKSLKAQRFQALGNFAISSMNYFYTLNYGKPRFDVACESALNPFFVKSEWVVNEIMEVLEADKASARKTEMAEETIYNLCINPGVGDEEWSALKAQFPWLESEYPALSARPSIPVP